MTVRVYEGVSLSNVCVCLCLCVLEGVVYECVSCVLILFVLMCVCVHEYVYLCGEQECPFPIQHVCSRGGASVQAFLFPFTYASQPLMSLYTTPILPPSPSRRPEFSPPE